MFNITSVYDNIRRFNFSEPFQEFSRVELDLSEDSYVSSGNKTGRTLRFECPLIAPRDGDTQKTTAKEVADNVLEQIKGFVYQPYTSSSVRIDPAVELGDGLFVSDVYSGIYVMETRFGHTYTADLAAPSEEEIDHEYPYEAKTDRKINRRISNVQSELKVQNESISAKVSREGGNDDGSFGWNLTDKKWEITANGEVILKVSRSGLRVNGDGTFTGNVYAGNIKSGKSNGVNYGTFNGSGITAGTIARRAVDSNIEISLDHADRSNRIFNREEMADSVWTSAVRVGPTGEMYRPGTIAFYDSLGNYREYKVLMLASE